MMSIRPYTDEEDEQWGDPPTIPSSFNEVGEYKHCVVPLLFPTSGRLFN
jgi:hypothetical protein